MAELETGTRIGSSSISDFCLLVQDLERAIEFYRDRVGFKLRRLAPGFADFFTAGVTLALWQVDHMQAHLQLPPGMAAKGRWRTMAAVQVESRERVLAMHLELLARGVPFLVGPQAYPWNAYACYFTDPEDNLWEIYTWQEGGHANLIFSGEP
jgi:catechol 2,3-dioxygenase-like lactoylglutathione lyase family enzyme